MQLGLADVQAGFAYLARSVPRRSLARLGLAIAGLALTRAALPLVAWLDAGRDHGLLRARPSQNSARGRT